MNSLKNSSNNFFIKSTFKRYMIPSVLSVLGSTITVLIDSIITGNFIGSNALAALIIASPVYFTFATLGSLICVGGATCANICIGKDDEKGCNRYLSLSLFLSIIIGIIFSAAGLCALNPIVKFLGGTGELYQMVYDYSFIMLAGGVSVVLMYFPFNFLRVDGRPQYGVVMFIIMAVSNAILDLVFTIIFHLGISGIALASVISIVLADIAGFYFLFSKRCTLKLMKPEYLPESIKNIFISGSSMALNNLCSVFRPLLINRLLTATFGAAAVTVFSLTSSVGSFALAILSGVAQTITPLIGVFYGERDITSIRLTNKLALKNGLIMITIFAALVGFFAKPICILFGIQDSRIIRMAVPALILYSLSLIIGMINNIFIFHYFTTGWNTLANSITFARAFGFIVFSVAIFTKIGSLTGVWTSFLIAEILSFGLLTVITAIKRKSDPKLSLFFLLNTSYEKSGHYISFSVPNDITAAAEAAERITEFCDENNLNMKTTMMVSLSLEEMLVCICEHCFQNGEEQSVDVRVFHFDDMIILRMRNSGIVFDPIEYYEKKKFESDGSMIVDDAMGIAMIVKKADAVIFKRTFGMNNLTIIIHSASEGRGNYDVSK